MRFSHSQTCTVSSAVTWPTLVQALPSPVFLQLLAGVFRVTQTLLQHVCRIRDVTDSVLRAARCPRAHLAQHDSEFSLVLQAVAEAASGRLSKLLCSR